MARRKNSESIGNDSEFGDNYVEEPNFSDPEDFVDDVAEEGGSACQCRFKLFQWYGVYLCLIVELLHLHCFDVWDTLSSFVLQAVIMYDFAVQSASVIFKARYASKHMFNI